MMKAASRILIAKMQTVKLLPLEGRSVQEAIGRMAEAEIGEAVVGVAEGIVGAVLAVAVGQEVAAIVVLVVGVEIAATAKTSAIPNEAQRHCASFFCGSRILG